MLQQYQTQYNTLIWRLTTRKGIQKKEICMSLSNFKTSCTFKTATPIETGSKLTFRRICNLCNSKKHETRIWHSENISRNSKPEHPDTLLKIINRWVGTSSNYKSQSQSIFQTSVAHKHSEQTIALRIQTPNWKLISLPHPPPATPKKKENRNTQLK